MGFNGRAWLISPDGKVLASTYHSRPFVTVEIDIDEAEKAKQTYPRNIPE